MGLYTPADAQVPRHPAYNRRDAHPDRRNALTPGGAATGAGGQRQTGALHSLRSTRPTAQSGAGSRRSED